MAEESWVGTLLRLREEDEIATAVSRLRNGKSCHAGSHEERLCTQLPVCGAATSCSSQVTHRLP